MLTSSIAQIFKEVWPNILLTCVILSSVRIAYLIIHKEKFVFYKEVLMLLFAIYILCLFYVVTFQDVDWSSNNFIPFREMFRYEFGSGQFIKNVLGNTLMFLPFGWFISYFLNRKKALPIFILILIASITIELTQLKIGRVFDVDDIILNIVGGMLGFFLYYLFSSIGDKMPSFLKKEAFYNIIVLLLLIGGISLFILTLGGI